MTDEPVDRHKRSDGRIVLSSRGQFATINRIALRDGVSVARLSLLVNNHHANVTVTAAQLRAVAAVCEAAAEQMEIEHHD